MVRGLHTVVPDQNRRGSDVSPMTLSTDEVYALIKQLEPEFSPPAPYVTVDVGTLDAATGVFQGLTTTVEQDPEPIEHGPKDHPHNPAPRFTGDRWVSVTISASWRQTITSVPAPHVPLAPVLLRFSILNAATTWSVTVNGTTVSAPPTQGTILVDVWDAAVMSWSIVTGGVSRQDSLRLQRPAGALGAALGAFTVPVLPVSIIYAPPADSLGASSAKYTAAQTVGTTVDFGFSDDRSSTTPVNGSDFATSMPAFTAALDSAAQVLSVFPATEAVGKGFSTASSVIGKFSATNQTGVTDGTQSTVTLTRSTSDAFATSAKIGGPGAGDVLHFFKDVRMVWAYFGGRLRICPLGYSEVFVTAAGLRAHPDTAGISAADADALLRLDPFGPGAARATLPADRFTLLETWEYGLGITLDHQVTQTRETKQQTTHSEYTSDTQSWDPGPIFKLLGFGNNDTTKITVTNATGDSVSSTVTVDANLVSGPQDWFVVQLWYDNLFGTFAFDQLVPAAAAKLTGKGSQPAQEVVLQVAGKVFRTFTDKNGEFQFRGPGIPSGPAKLTVGGHTSAVTVITGPMETLIVALPPLGGGKKAGPGNPVEGPPITANPGMPPTEVE